MELRDEIVLAVVAAILGGALILLIQHFQRRWTLNDEAEVRATGRSKSERLRRLRRAEVDNDVAADREMAA